MKAFRILFAVILITFLVTGCSSENAVPRSGENTKVYFTQGGDQLVVSSGGTLDVQSGATLNMAGTLSSSGGTVAFTDDVSVSGRVIYTVSDITPANGSTLNPSATYYNVNSSAGVTITLGTSGAVTGQMLYLYGDDNNTITIADTNILTSDGNAATIGQYDVLVFVYNGSKWAQVSKSANS